MPAAMRKRMRIAPRGRVDDPEIIVIPMIDVMMFLLFFFMVASLAMAVQNGIPVNLPKAATSREQNAQTVTITLRADGSTFLNTGRVEIGQLQAKLAALGVTPRTFITINADERVILGRVIAAMDEARKAGVTSFGFATNRR